MLIPNQYNYMNCDSSQISKPEEKTLTGLRVTCNLQVLIINNYVLLGLGTDHIQAYYGSFRSCFHMVYYL